MPPRWLTLAILVFWAGTTAWMVQREVVPRIRAGYPPPFSIDLTDEVSGSTVQWQIFQEGKKVGSGSSSVRRGSDRTFKLQSEFTFTEVNLHLPLALKKMTSMYQVTAEGELRELAATTLVCVLKKDIEVQVTGQVKDGFLNAQAELAGASQVQGDGAQLAEAKVPVPANVLNPMHLVNKINGLREGQTWTIPLLDVSAILPTSKSIAIPLVEGNVLAETLTWNGTAEPCFKIEYRPVGKDQVSARTWVRQRDGTVLQQEALHQGMELVLVRLPNR